MFPKPLTPQKTNYRDSLGSLGLIQPKLRGSVAEDHMLGSSFSPPPSSPFRADANRFSESLSLSPCRTTDRYVPDRNNIDYDFCNHYLNQTPQDENADAATLTPGQRKLNREIKQLGMKKSGKRLIDCFESRRESIDESVESIIRKPKEEAIETNSSSQRTGRIIPIIPSKVLDAPDLMNDYYLNLLDWGYNNIIAVALNQSVYLWHADNGRIDHLTELDSDQYVSSVQWSFQDNSLAIGTSNNTVQLWNADRLEMTREMRGHSARVSSLSWKDGNILSSGGRDSLIINHDIRERRSKISTYACHEQEVCGLAWSHDGSTLASGGNENKLCIWDASMSGATNRSSGLAPAAVHHPRHTIMEHIAAVKAVSWCPWQRNTLATGGGTADRTIRIWNASNGTNMRCVNTGSQVCAIQWSEHHKELVSSHGFSDNQLILWKYPNMTKIQEFRGHSARVLHLAKSPSGTTICSASADESMRFWDMFSAEDRLSISGIGSSSRRRSSLGSSGASRRESMEASPIKSSINSPKKPRVSLCLSEPKSYTAGLSMTLR